MVDVKGGVNLEGLRKQAKRWLKALRGGDGAALARLERVLPRHSAEPGLREVQQALAREQGFESWGALREHFEVAAVDGAGLTMLADEFLLHACIFSGGPLDFPQKWRRAERIRLRHPEVVRHSLHTAVVCGEVEHARKLLRDDAGLVHVKTGPQKWEPLLYVCYSRLPDERAAEASLALAELLLDAGADPNTASTENEWSLRFTALCGVMGHGEMGAPEHPQADALARLLLDRGADPNDGQGLYDTHLASAGDDTRWLELLASYGLKAEDLVNWDAKPQEGGGRMFDYLLPQAAAWGHGKRARWLLEHGADPNARSTYNGMTAYQNAVLHGKLDVAELLLEHGARREPLVGREAFEAACNVGDRELAERLLEGHPEYLEATDPLIDAATAGRLDVVRLLLELGMDPNREGRHGHRVLNNACNDKAACELLLAHGADPRRRAYGATPQNWARMGQNLEMARWHAEKSRFILDAVVSGHVELVKELVAETPACLDEKSPRGNTVFHELPADAERAEELIELFLAYGVDPELRNDDGKTAIEKLTSDGADDVADLLEVAIGDRK